jgi:microcystin-dependent protein
MLAHGANISRTEYPRIAGILNVTVGQENFTLPDFSDRFLVGAKRSVLDILSTGGALTHNISLEEMPAHTHEMLASSKAAGVKTPSVGGGFGSASIYSASVSDANYISTTKLGAGIPISITPPMVSVSFIICVSQTGCNSVLPLGAILPSVLRAASLSAAWIDSNSALVNVTDRPELFALVGSAN